jgi:formamidopyrimidine-DNA glycosylase
LPELPEVEYVRRFLEPAMAGARIEQVILRRANLRLPFGHDFAARLEGQTIVAVRRRAKYLIVELSSGDALVMHLGMSGWFRVLGMRGRRRVRYREYIGHGDGEDALEKHDHVVFELSNGATVIFNDPRRFGFMKVASPPELAADRALAALGPEPLARAFTAMALAGALTGRKTSLKAALLDQRTVAGLGNIYACEALHVAKLSPKRRASTLATSRGEPRPAAFALADAIRLVLKDAIAHQHRAGGADRFRVYDHEGDRCPRRGCGGTITRMVQAGRSTFFCPVCQR